MLFLPIGCLLFAFFILALPFLFLLGYFHIVTLGFERLGIPSGFTFLILLAILFGSAINIPLGRKKVFVEERVSFFGLFRRKEPKIQGLAINLGGAVIPVSLSFYFLFFIWRAGGDLIMLSAALGLMIIVSKILSRVIPGKGVALPALVPPVFSAIFSLMLVPQFAAPTAFIAGTLGVLIGADLLNLRRAQKAGSFLSIGGAGVFDGIFLVGIVSALLAGL